MTKFFRALLNTELKLSVFAGVLLGVSFPPFNLFLLTIPAFMILLWVSMQSNGIRHVMYITYPAFLTWNIITTYWLTFATVSGGVAAILANAVIMTFPMAVIYKLRSTYNNSVLKAVLTASIWVAYEFLHYQWDLAWPWLTLGNAFANAPILIQYASVTGVMGVSFWVVFSASLLLDGISGRRIVGQEESNVVRNFQISGRAIVLILLLPVISLIQFIVYNPEPDYHTEIVVVQPNYDSYLHNAGYDDIDVALSEIISLTDSVLTPQTTMIFWPENALLPSVHHFQNRYPNDRLRNFAISRGSTLITGASWYRYYRPDEQPDTPRVARDGTRYNVYNAALAYQPDGSMSAYEKAKLVPIVERMPFYGTLRHIPGINWSDWMGYGRGNEMVNFSHGNIVSPALICYDSVFPDWVRRSVKDGAGFVTIITNDGWWGNTSGHGQHFDFARIRAIETRRAVVRSANNGISGMIYPSGKVHSRTTYWTRDALNIEVPVYSAKTFYVRFGDWIGMLALILIFISIVLSVQRHRKAS